MKMTEKCVRRQRHGKKIIINNFLSRIRWKEATTQKNHEPRNKWHGGQQKALCVFCAQRWKQCGKWLARANSHTISFVTFHFISNGVWRWPSLATRFEERHLASEVLYHIIFCLHLHHYASGLRSRFFRFGGGFLNGYFTMTSGTTTELSKSDETRNVSLLFWNRVFHRKIAFYRCRKLSLRKSLVFMAVSNCRWKSRAKSLFNKLLRMSYT